MNYSGIRTFSSRRIRRLGEYLEIPVSGSKIWRRNFFADLYYTGADLWIYHDRGRDGAGTYDQEKSGGDPDTLQAGPSLMFITIPKVFASMGMGTFVGILFFLLVLCAAVTSSIALTESAVSTFQDELGWSRKKQL